jgi:Mor family transcriptional regulator
MPDVLHDAADLLKAEGVAVPIVRRVIQELRRRWGGCEGYIAVHDREWRDATIKDALTEGQPVAVVAKVARCSVATVRRKRSQWL